MLFIAVVCLCYGNAFAAAIPPVPASRMQCAPPQGMQAVFSPSDGLFAVHINDEQTDWGKAMAYSANLSEARIFVDIVPPVGAVKYNLFVENDGASDAEILADFADMENWGAYYDMVQWVPQPTAVAEYIPARSVMVPRSFDDVNYFVRWYDNANAVIATEKMRVKVSHTSQKSFYASPSLIMQGDILTNTENLPYLSAQTSNGEVIYTVTNALAANNPSDVIMTKIKAPAGATVCERFLMWGGSQVLPVQNGYVEIPTWYKLGGGVLLTGIQQESSCLEWRDNTNQVLAANLLNIRLHSFEMKPWPFYITDPAWRPVPGDRLHVNQSLSAAGVQNTYQNGLLHYTYSGVLPDASVLDLSQISIAITAPQGARSYKTNQSSGEANFGNRSDQPQEADAMMSWRDGESIQNGAINAVNSQMFRKVTTDDHLTVYLSAVGTEPEDGSLYLIYWYSDDGATNLLAVEYFFESADPFVQIVETPALPSEAAIPGSLAEPVIVGQPNWKLVTEHHPQAGNNARHYELHVKDEEDNIVILPSNAVVYLPYPPGFDVDSNATYTLKHYDLEFENYGNVQIEPTEKGLRFVTSSLSPFVISWAARQPISPPPKTGDFFPTEMLIAAIALLLGMTGLITFKKRKRSA